MSSFATHLLARTRTRPSDFALSLNLACRRPSVFGISSSEARRTYAASAAKASSETKSEGSAEGSAAGSVEGGEDAKKEEGTVLTGLQILKDRPAPVALRDEEYPAWLWKTLDRSSVEPGAELTGKEMEREVRKKLRKKNRREIKASNFLKAS